MTSLPTWAQWLLFAAQLVAALAIPLLAWYALETMRLRRATEEQVRHALMPVLKVRFTGEEILVENLGPGIAGKVLMQPINYIDPAGGTVHCTFRPLFMVHPLRAEPVRLEMIRKEPITPVSLEFSDEHGVTVVDLSPSRLKDLIIAAGHKVDRFVQTVFYTDIIGRSYRLPVAWEHPTIQTRLLGLSHPEPTAENPVPVDSLPEKIEPLKIHGESLIP
jgi:hypothetical protein